MSKKTPRYTDEFKIQIVELYNNGKPGKQIVEEYEIARSTLHKWVNDYNNTQSFRAKDNRSNEKMNY